jgi:hypothetical protein
MANRQAGRGIFAAGVTRRAGNGGCVHIGDCDRGAGDGGARLVRHGTNDGASGTHLSRHGGR